MANLNEKLDLIKRARDNIKTALLNKGQEVNEDIRTYAEAINNIKEGPDTSDATATSYDIINPKTAYVNGEKIKGNIIPTYKKSNLNVFKEKLLVESNKNYVLDYSYDNNIAISSTSYDNISDVFINNDTITKNINVSNIDSSYSNIFAAKFYGVPENDIQKIILIVLDNSSNMRALMLEIDINTLEIKNTIADSAYSFLNVSGFNLLGCKIVVNPTIKDAIAVSVKYDKGGNSAFVNVSILRIIDNSFTTLCDNRINNGLNDWKSPQDSHMDTCWSPNGKNLLVTFSAVWFGNKPKFTYIVYYNNNLTSATVVNTDLSTDGPACFLNDKYFIKNGNIYNYENQTIRLNKTITEVVANNANDYIAVLNNYFLIYFNFSNKTIKIYTYNEDLEFTYIKNYTWNIILSDPRICINTLSFANYYSFSRIMYSEDNVVQTIYTTNDGNEYESLNIIGKEYYNTSECITSNDKILQGEKVFTSSGRITGTMPNNGELNYTPSTEVQTIPEGYTSGGSISAVDITTLEDYKNCEKLSSMILGNNDNKPYTKLEYIGFTGTQYIEPILLNSNYRIEFYISVDSSSSYHNLFENNNASPMLWITDSSQVELNERYRYTIQTNTPIHIINDSTQNDSKLYINNVLMGTAPKISGRAYAVTMFNRNGAQCFKGKVYYVKVYKKDTLEKELIPVKDTNNVTCLFDTISRTYYYNIGTGTFTAGGVV